MADDTIRNVTETGEIGKELFFKEWRDRIIHIGRECLLPEVLEDSRRSHSRVKERRKEPKTFFYLFLYLFTRPHKLMSEFIMAGVTIIYQLP